MADVSVILPFFNNNRFLALAIESVLASTLKNLEIILINDGSDNGSGAVAESFAAQDSRIRLINRSHHGLVSTLNYGIQQSQSSIIARLDADDIVFPDRFGVQYSDLKAHPGIALVSCKVVLLSDFPLSEGIQRYIKWVNNSISSRAIRRDLFRESPVPHPSVIYRKDVIWWK